MSEKGAKMTDRSISFDQNFDEFKIPYIAWEIMTKCNMGCQFCYSSSWDQWRYDRSNFQSKLKSSFIQPSKEDIIKGLKILKDSNLGIHHINYSGGEVLLRQFITSRGKGDILKGDVPEILKESAELGFKNILSTNGMFSTLFGKSERESRRKYKEFLHLINDHLDFLSISWDADTPDVNNNVMRLNASGKGGSGYHYKDIQYLLDLFEKEYFSFHLKINTLITRKNYFNVYGILDRLKYIPCIWNLVQFNPRECPVNYRKEFWINNSIFYELVNELVKRNSSSSQPSRCSITTRAYDGRSKPYCFLVINTAGEILVPKGEKHIVVLDNFPNGWNTTPNELKIELAHNIINVISNNRIKNYNNSINHLKEFSNKNNKIWERYLNPTFRDQEAVRRMNKLTNIERTIIAGVYDWHSHEFCDQNNKNTFAKEEEDFIHKLWWTKESHQDKSGTQYHILLKYLMEQQKLAKILRGYWGIIGGTMVVINPNESQYRIVPYLDRAPEGVHFPWVFESISSKMKFFAIFFRGGVHEDESLNSDRDTLIKRLLIKRILPNQILIDVVKLIITNETYRKTIVEEIKQLLNNFNIVNIESKDLNTKRIISIILSCCIEKISSIISKAFLNKQDSIDKIPDDPLYKLFWNDYNRNESLSTIEQDMNMLFVSAEEGIWTVCNWLNNLKLEEYSQDVRYWFIGQKHKWSSLKNSSRVRSWMSYHKKKTRYEDTFRCKMLTKALNNNTFITDRVFPIFWLYYFDPMIGKDDSIFYIPHLLFFPYRNNDYDNDKYFVAFVELHFDDETFRRLWFKSMLNNLDSSNLWNNPFNEGEIKRYVRNIINWMSPIANYNTNLEIIKERERLTKDAEWKNIVDEMSHSMRHQFGEIGNRLSSIMVGFNRNDKNIFMEAYKRTDVAISQLSLINEYMLCVMKSGNDKDESEIIKNTLKIDKNIDLSEIIMNCVDTLECSLDFVDFSYLEHKINVQNIGLYKLRKSIDQLSEYQISVNRTGFKIICLDLLKNAVKHTNATDPIIIISLSEYDDTRYALHFKNNQRMLKEAYEFIQNDIESKKWSKTQKVGIRTVKKILSYPKFAASEKNWKLYVDPSSIEGDWTDIMLLIPMEDIHEKNKNT